MKTYEMTYSLDDTKAIAAHMGVKVTSADGRPDDHYIFAEFSLADMPHRDSRYDRIISFRHPRNVLELVVDVLAREWGHSN